MIDEKELVWVARYKDGSFSTQYNVDGSYRDRYADIVRKELKFFELWKPDMKTLVLRVHFDSPEKKLIWRSRVFKRAGKADERMYLVGWQMKVGGKNVQSICGVFEDGHMEIIDRWPKEGQPHFAKFEEPIHHPHEGEDWEPIPDALK